MKVISVNAYAVEAQWDPVARVWVATSDGVPGVAIEAATCEEVIEVVKDALPDLFRENGLDYSKASVSVVFDTRVETIRSAAA